MDSIQAPLLPRFVDLSFNSHSTILNLHDLHRDTFNYRFAMIPCILAAIFVMGAVCVPFILIASLVAPLILSLMVIAAKVSVLAIPVFIVGAVLLDIQRRAEEERAREAAREAARIAAIEQERLRRERAVIEAEAQRRYRARQQIEAQRRDAIPGAMGWFVRAMHNMVSASSGISAGSPGIYDYQEFNMNIDPPRPSVPPTSATPVTDSGTGGDCAVCCDRAANTLLMPCKHLALCGVSRLCFCCNYC